MRVEAKWSGVRSNRLMAIGNEIERKGPKVETKVAE